jgi:F0F1-type ATP synthase assembly protein I
MAIGVVAAVYTVVREVSRSYRVAAREKSENGRKEDQT